MDLNKADFNVDEYRSSHESEAEWKLRRAFIISNREYLSKDKLVCLASCYVNVHFYGCGYPDDVMQELAHYENNVERRLITEYRPSNSSDTPRRIIHPVRRRSDNTSWRAPPPRNDQVNIQTGNTESSNDFIRLERKFSQLAATLKGLISSKPLTGVVDILQMALDKSKMIANVKYVDSSKRTHSCVLYVDCVLVSRGESSNKKQAKADAFQNAADKLDAEHFKIIKSEDDPEEYALVGSARLDDFNSASDDRREDDIDPDFVILEQRDVQNSALSCFRRSAEFNKMQIGFDVEYLDSCREHECRISLEGKVVAIGRGCLDKDAVSDAAEKALDKARRVCYTIVAKDSSDILLDDAIQRNGLLSENAALAAPIPDSNIGNRLLRKMGWSGGGVGKEGNQGIVNPISLDAVVNREGLGMQRENGIQPDFRQSVAQIIEDFIKSDAQDDLVFSPSFSMRERAMIHSIAQKMHLKNRSYNKGEDRYLVLSRKRTPRQLVDHILANDGETRRYTLNPPTAM